MGFLSRIIEVLCFTCGSPAGRAAAPRKEPKSRRGNFWEPIYAPGPTVPLATPIWTSGNSKFEGCLISGEACEQRRGFQGMHFEACDFVHTFSAHRMFFKECVFLRCDLGLAVWKGVKFSRCKFILTSFTQGSFIDCDFQECTFSDISLSGNDLRLEGTIFSNPDEFIGAAYTNLDRAVLRDHGVTAQYQISRLEETKAAVSRTVLDNLRSAGSDAAFFAAVKTASVQSLRAKLAVQRLARSQSKSTPFKLWFLAGEGIVYWELTACEFAGAINGWGSSIAKPALVGIGVVCLFSWLYIVSGTRDNLGSSVLTTLDVTFLFGYTKEVTAQSYKGAKLLMVINAFVGLFWYAVAAPTIVNRVSRAR